MIKMAGTNPKTGRRLIILGIEGRNVERLKQGHPIHIIADELGFEGEIIIHYEETMEKLEAKFRPYIGPETRVTDNKKRQ
jgi:hypothetical protein